MGRTRLAAGVFAALVASAAARAEAVTGTAADVAAPRGSGFAVSADAALWSGAAQARMHLDASLALPEPLALQEVLGSATEAAAPTRRPKWIWIGAASAVAVGGSLYNAVSEKPHFPFHVTHEGWFGRDTYAGGADKASHFVSYWGVSLILNEVNLAFGAPREQAILLASGASLLAGVATELGDGINKYGYSWEDVTMDALGAGAALAVVHFRLEDLVGFRIGLVPAPKSPVGGLGKDYSQEMYTADLKIAGLSRRLDFDPWIARFLMLSMTYGVKGYPYAPPEIRARMVGIEIGLNFGAIMQALGVPRQKWWGVCLYTLFDIVRFPYTAVGYRYDLNNGKWYGPDTGDSYPTGP
jgi:hypothetical protein